MKTSGHKYCFFDISIAGKALNRVVIQLFHNDLPITCENFLSLCKGFSNDKKEKVSYKDTTFHRVVKGGYIQGGDLSSLTSNN
jgi:cyclophilin family peptidyl-prolyl cis-trans isomerase